MELGTYIQFLLALLFILALIGGLAWAARRFKVGDRLVASTGGSRRLSIVEIRPVDARRKLILLRRDNREHLVLLGPTQDLLLESGIETKDQLIDSSSKKETS